MTTLRPSRFLPLLAAAAVIALAACQTTPAQASPAEASPAATAPETRRDAWAASWAASPSTFVVTDAPPPLGRVVPVLEGTVRYTMRISAGGERVRVVLDGGPSVRKLTVSAATIALVDDNGVDASTLRPLTFSGATQAQTLSAGAPIWSDPVAMRVPDGGLLAITLYIPEPVRVANADPQLVTEKVAGADLTREAVLPDAERLVARPLVTAVHVDNPTVTRVIAAFGDSITDGTGSLDPLMRGWPDYLAERMRAAGMDHVAIVNHGIGGNRLLQDSVGESALARFDRDVLAMPGITDVIILEGINDLGLSGLTVPWLPEPMPELAASDIVAAYEQLIARAKARGIRVIGATLTPDLGTAFPGYATEEKDVIRNEINDWIRTSGAFDAVIDFDAAVRDPVNPQYLNPEYDAGDRIHPSDAGYRAMADAIDLELFR